MLQEEDAERLLEILKKVANSETSIVDDSPFSLLFYQSKGVNGAQLGDLYYKELLEKKILIRENQLVYATVRVVSFRGNYFMVDSPHIASRGGVKGFYSNNFDSLIKFIDEGIFTLIEKKDSSYLQYDRIYRIDMLREVVVIDTLGFVPVKDSLFKDDNEYKSMYKVPIEGVDANFTINSDIIIKNNYRVPVFEVKVLKNIILFDQDKDLLKQENETVSVDAVNGPAIVLGSMVEVSANGNWPTIFDARK